jgi:hypothetical protein
MHLLNSIEMQVIGCLLGALLQFPHGGSHRARDSGGAAVVVVVLEDIFLAIMVPPMMVLIWVSSLVCAC